MGQENSPLKMKLFQGYKLQEGEGHSGIYDYVYTMNYYRKNIMGEKNVIVSVSEEEPAS